MSSSSVHIETTHTPQGDGNIGEECRVGVPEETTHTPQGDGNFCAKSCHSPSTPGNNPHPARGRKLVPVLQPYKFSETTHTPQGDGNRQCIPSSLHLHEKQPTPRKGTETPTRKSSISSNLKQPTPRKGTETILLTVLLHRSFETTHTPQGDGNNCWRACDIL